MNFIQRRQTRAKKQGMIVDFIFHKIKTYFMQNSPKTERKEGDVTKNIEDQTSKLPSDTFLWAAIASMAVSLTFQLAGKKHTSLFFGQWPAPFLLFGIYNKLVKQEGHDATEY
jgi:hypothetical protein